MQTVHEIEGGLRWLIELPEPLAIGGPPLAGHQSIGWHHCSLPRHGE